MAVEFNVLDNEELAFDVENTVLIRGPRGYSITKVEKIAGTHAAGALDTYRVYIDDGTTNDFQVYNGKDAYTYAVAAGYEGTETEFAELMGHFAEYYEAAKASANEILNIAPHIYASAEDASHSATAAADSAANANGAASSAGYYAQNAANAARSAQAYSNGAGVSASAAESAKNAALDAKEAIENMTVSAATLPAGSAASVTKSIVSDVVHLAFGIPEGADGTSIANIAKTSSSGLVDTYTVTLTDGTTYTITVTNGAKGDTGNGIASIRQTGGNHAPGTTDTYTITFTDGATSTFTVYNGADGEGSGDMNAAVYDPAGGARQVAFEDELTAHNTDASAHANLYIRAGQKSGTTLGAKATAEGKNVTASGDYSHAEGDYTTASGDASHTEGNYTTASGDLSHAEGYHTTASGFDSHAEGDYTTASGDASHTEGYHTTASSLYSHAEGNHTTAQRKSQHVFGEYNVPDTAGTTSTRGTYVEIVGNGTSDDDRSNARTLDWSGNETLTGKLTLGEAPTADMDAATKQYVDGAISAAIGNAIGGSY